VEKAQVENDQTENGHIESAQETAIPVPTTVPRIRRAIPGPEQGWLSRLRSYFILDPLVWLYTLVMGLAVLPASIFDRDGRRQHWFSYAWSWLIMKSIFSPVKIIGLDKIDTSKAHVYAVNHGSALDIPLIYAYLPFQFRVAFKKELLSYPLLIFPEGGRTDNGDIKPFLPGAFFLAIKAQVDIVPVALVGTYELLPMNTYHIKCRPLEMRVGEPIPTAGLTTRDMESLSARVKSALEELYYQA
jgi:1-acyl-sn-glycerol-3-phosphate acyltransferase